jgi:hypothetical protein
VFSVNTAGYWIVRAERAYESAEVCLATDGNSENYTPVIKMRQKVEEKRRKRRAEWKHRKPKGKVKKETGLNKET